LFLAFPAIFPASVTLVEKHEKKRKAEAGMHGQERAMNAAGADAMGACLGSLGLIAFAALVWQLLVKMPSWAVLMSAVAAWFAGAASAWILWKKRPRHFHKRPHPQILHRP
jgi:hypothetical protein